MFKEDTSAFLRFDDFGVWAELGSQRALVILDSPDGTVLGDHVQTTDYAITCRNVDLDGSGHGDWLLVDGVEYEVQAVSFIDDGAFKRVALQKVTP